MAKAIRKRLERASIEAVLSAGLFMAPLVIHAIATILR